MVGLPARGKSFIARKIARYLTWIGVSCRVFNVSSYRRERIGAKQTNEFFDPSNLDGNRARLHMAIAALDDMVNWLNKEGYVAIYDATNITREKRDLISKRAVQESFQLVFVECIANDPSIIEKNIQDLRFSPDYQSMEENVAIQDFKKRIAQYEKQYQPLDESERSFVKYIDGGKSFIVNNIETYLPSRVVHFVMNLHATTRTIWLSRHGESEDNVKGLVGGDSNLTPKGDAYAHKLADWVEANIANKFPSTTNGLVVWTSALKRTIQTAQYINHPKMSLQPLNEIDVGICEGMTYDDIAEKFPDEYAARAADKLKYRYPHGESYLDVIQRLEPVLFELERQKSPVLVVSHQAVLRCIYAYFTGAENDQIPFIQFEQHVVYELSPGAYGCKVKTYSLL